MSEEEGKLYITISDRRGEDGQGETVPGTSPTGGGEKATGGGLISDYAKHEFITLIKSGVSAMVSQGVANIGNVKGDYTTQRNVSDAMKMASAMEGIAMAAFAGLKYTGSAYGAMIGAGVAVGMQTIGGIQQLFNERVQYNKQEYEISMLRQRSGLDGLTNGSRTGDSK